MKDGARCEMVMIKMIDDDCGEDGRGRRGAAVRMYVEEILWRSGLACEVAAMRCVCLHMMMVYDDIYGEERRGVIRVSK